MSLQCPTRLYIARHGAADHDEARVLSDEGGWLTERGREQVRSCARSLTADRIAAVQTSPREPAVESGRVAASILSVGLEVLPGLAEIAVGECAGRPRGDRSFQDVYDAWTAGDLQVRVPGAESGAEVIARFREAVESVADRFRGEQVLVFSHSGVMSLAIPRLATNTPDSLADNKPVPPADPAVLEVGDEGWRVVSWPRSSGSPAR